MAVVHQIRTDRSGFDRSGFTFHYRILLTKSTIKINKNKSSYLLLCLYRTFLTSSFSLGAPAFPLMTSPSSPSILSSSSSSSSSPCLVGLGLGLSLLFFRTRPSSSVLLSHTHSVPSWLTVYSWRRRDTHTRLLLSWGVHAVSTVFCTEK